ncbi:DUF3413 domain-containing protein [Utexia brackfieldae]|uniref:DUF3413 domain-containing protein n=1 Tax=Utexia brackfieldae TaxID=3074108 RepID=UPI00370D4DE2
MILKIKNKHQHDDDISQIISWGHWFTLFNIFIVTLLGSRYVLIADWPATFMGRLYAILSTIGQFSFLCFIVYIIFLFPLSFLIRSSRWLRIIATIIATVGVTLLLIDVEVFLRFRMHLNITIWNIVTESNQNTLIRDWQKLFIFVPIIFLVETLFSIWCWKKLRSLTKRRKYAKPVVIVLILSFLSSHLIHIWADANFYRPITMQRSSLPLSYPMTARHFLMKYGFISSYDYNQREIQEGNPFAIAVEYPLTEINYNPPVSPDNILFITIDSLSPAMLSENNMPVLMAFAQQNMNYTQHYSASGSESLGLFSLFYGIDPNYYNSIMVNHQSSVLLNTIAKQNYNLGLFSADGFNLPLYQTALLSNFSLPKSEPLTNNVVTDNWLDWMDNLDSDKRRAPWFSLINYQITDDSNNRADSTVLTLKQYQRSLQQIDKQLSRVLSYLANSNLNKNTIVIITATHGVDVQGNKVMLSNNKDRFDRDFLAVPLVLAWPNKEAQVIDKPSSHVDIMRTLMENELGVTTPSSKYSQGYNLLELPEKRNWLIAGNETAIAALYPEKTVVIDSLGHYKIYDDNHQELKDEKLSLGTFLQLMTSNRRFMVTN